MTCKFCKSSVHVWFDCPKKPDGWKPERLRKSSTAVPRASGARQGDKPSAKDGQPAAPAVETNSVSVAPSDTEATEASRDKTGRSGERPLPKFKDRHPPGYNTNYKREWRRKRAELRAKDGKDG